MKMFNILVFSLVLLVSVPSVSYSNESVIRLGYSDAEAFPFQIREDANPPGIAFEIISAAASEIGVKIKYVRLPNRRVQASLEDGIEIDGAFMFSFSKERTENGRYPLVDDRPDRTKRIATLSYYIYKMKDNPLKWDGKKFRGFSDDDDVNVIGANSGYSVVNDLEKVGVKVDDGARTTDQNFKKLFMNRIIAFAHQDNVADYYLESRNIEDVVRMEPPFIQKDYFLLYSHQYYNENTETANKLWDKIAEIRDKKTKEIMSKYMD